MVPCSIWMPPLASGPVLTVSNPILTGFCCANAGTDHVVASALPTRNERRPILSDLVPSLSGARRSRKGRRAFSGHPASDRPVTQLMPQAIDLGQHDVIGLVDVDRIGDRPPAGPAGDPEDLRAIAFGIEEITADRA